MMSNQLRCTLPALLFAFFLVGFPVSCTSANLRAGFSGSVAEENTIIPDSDLVDVSSFLVVQVDGYDMHDLRRISPKKQAIIECAFHEAFNEVHGDRDGLYLSGQQIVATDRSDEGEGEDEDDEDDYVGGNDSLAEGIAFKTRKYVHRPRKFPPKDRDKPENPPPKPPKTKHTWEDKWDIYLHVQVSGMCNMCYLDDDYFSMEDNYDSVPLNSDKPRNENIELSRKHDREQRGAFDHAMSESSVNAIADALRKNLIDGSCVRDDDDSFEYVRDTEIYVLSQSDFEESVAAIAASVEVGDDAPRAVSQAATTDSVAQPAATAAFPFYYGNSSSTNLAAASTSGDGFQFFKVGLSGVDCGAWNNEDLLDLNSGLHDAINSMGLTDRGHVMDKIVRRNQAKPRFGRVYGWKCHYDVYTRLGLDNGTKAPDDYVLADIGDALCDDLGQYGWKNKFRNVIDCLIEPVTELDYRSIVATAGDKKIGLAVSSERE